MSDSDAPLTLTLPPPLPPFQPLPTLFKHRSWSPDMCREEVWLRRKTASKNRGRRTRSVTDEDLDELKACIELGFGFDSPDVADKRLSDTLPALQLFYAVNRNYSKSTPSDSDTTQGSIFVPGEDSETMKARLRQWAQVVGCSVRQSPDMKMDHTCHDSSTHLPKS